MCQCESRFAAPCGSLQHQQPFREGTRTHGERVVWGAFPPQISVRGMGPGPSARGAGSLARPDGGGQRKQAEPPGGSGRPAGRPQTGAGEYFESR